ncbi:FHA domain-containing protein [Anaeromyxobacter paludicola]|uniref:FHA domain-containing protein n=1 Tax=Anaeromyxobacter paludicola TaxID=2918171 RepID=A0ABM7X8E0_9BACT|nr:FHA domain-containing protein [Anaeromyxobacter paludicola]BDG08087.1 hypothetical protein AMPC_12000 [Anaeromyxobacter paludicola]
MRANEPGGRPEGTRTLAGRILRGEPLPAELPHLRVVAGPGAGETVPLADGVTLGRALDADCRLADPAASRRHARVEARAAGEVLVDLGSKNGVRVNGRRLRRPRPLRHGDRIRIGRTELQVVRPAPPRAGPAPASAGASHPRRLRLRLLAAAGLLALAAGWLAVPR